MSTRCLGDVSAGWVAFQSRGEYRIRHAQLAEAWGRSSTALETRLLGIRLGYGTVKRYGGATRRSESRCDGRSIPARTTSQSKDQ